MVVPMPQILGISWQTTPQGGMQEEIFEVTQFIPHERIVVVPVPPPRNKLWESRSFFRRSRFRASQSRLWYASTADHGGIVVVIQLVHCIAAQIVGKSWRCSARRERSDGVDCGRLWPNAADPGGNHGFFSWLVDSDDPSHEPSMANSSWSSRAWGGAGSRWEFYFRVTGHQPVSVTDVASW